MSRRTEEFPDKVLSHQAFLFNSVLLLFPGTGLEWKRLQEKSVEGNTPCDDQASFICHRGVDTTAVRF